MSGRYRVAALAALAAVSLAACANAAGVRTLDAAESDGDPFTPPGDTVATDPGGSVEIQPPPNTVAGRAHQLLNFGDDKQPRFYDDFLVAALNDVEVWWSQQYPQIYGEPFEPLAGGIYAGYPERTDPIPGCGPESETRYDELVLYAAFYCPYGDFMAYDDGESGLLFQLADHFGASVMGVVLAHEYGHAIQQRAGVIDQNPATIYTEQQADCFSGAWLAHAIRGEAEGVQLTDADIRAGLVALIQVRDPIGVDQLTPGGHGSGFDRVGAFQTGYAEGPQRCADLIDNPLPLMPNVFVSATMSSPEGNSPYGYDNGQMPGLAAADLNQFWTSVLGNAQDPFTDLELVPFSSTAEVSCDADLMGDIDIGALYCPSSKRVFLDEALARDYYEQFGDFAVGYMVGTAWSEAAQESFDSPLQGEDRALINDCLTGAWSAGIIPDASGQTPRGRSGNSEVIIEPGDLDEALQTALIVGDTRTDDDIIGSAFEKVASFRAGVIGGVDACRQLLQD